MRLIEALAASAVIHAALLALPTGQLALNGSPGTMARAQPLRVELRAQPRDDAATKMEVAEADAALTAAQSLPEPLPTTPDIAPPPAEAANDVRPAAPSELGVPFPHYYSPQEVSERAKPAQEIDLDSPELQAIPSSGKLILVLWINERGEVDKVDVGSSEVDGAMEKVIADQFRKARFAPALLDGQAVKSRMKIEVTIRPPTVYRVPPPPPRPKPVSAAES